MRKLGYIVFVLLTCVTEAQTKEDSVAKAYKQRKSDSLYFAYLQSLNVKYGTIAKDGKYTKDEGQTKEDRIVISRQRPSLIPFRKGDKWGYCDTTKKIIIEINFARAFPFVNGKAIVKTPDGKIQQINTFGKVIKTLPYSMNDYVAPEYGWIRITTMKEIQMGLLSINGEVILQPKFEAVDVLGPDSIRVTLKRRRWTINLKGEVLVKSTPLDDDEDGMPQPIMISNNLCEKPCLYKPYSEHMAVVAHKNLFGFANEKKKIVIPCKYALAQSFFYGLAWVMFDAPGEIREAPVIKDGVTYSKATKINEGFIDALGNEYWED